MFTRLSLPVNLLLWLAIATVINYFTGTRYASISVLILGLLVITRDVRWFGRQFVRTVFWKYYWRDRICYTLSTTFKGAGAYIFVARATFCDVRQYALVTDELFMNWLFDVKAEFMDFRSEDDKETDRLREEAAESDPTDWDKAIYNGKVVDIDSIPDSDESGTGG